MGAQQLRVSMGLLKSSPKITSQYVGDSSTLSTAVPSPVLTSTESTISPSLCPSSPGSPAPWLHGGTCHLNIDSFLLPEALDSDHDVESETADSAHRGLEDTEEPRIQKPKTITLTSRRPPLSFCDVANELSLPGHAATGEWARTIAPRPNNMSADQPVFIRCSSAGLILEPATGWSEQFIAEMERMDKLAAASKTRGEGAARPRMGRSRSPENHVEDELAGEPRGRARFGRYALREFS